MPGPYHLILLDRDGVINHDSDQFIRHPDEWHAIDGSIEAICRLQKVAAVGVCTNQSGVGRGYLNLPTLCAIHDKMNNALLSAGGQPLDIYFCPHLPDTGCRCRKPADGLLKDAMAAHSCAVQNTLMIGDAERDIEAALASGCDAGLVLTGKGAATKQTAIVERCTFVAEDLRSLVHTLFLGELLLGS